MFNKSFFTKSILLAAVFSAPSFAGSVKDIVPEIQSAAANSVVIEAVKKQNIKSLSMDKITELDTKWKATKDADAFMMSHTTNAAAEYLSSIEKDKNYLVEFIVTDNQGANVALTDITSDYWQGDEPKFKNAFAGGNGKVYIARPQKDKSTGEVVSQVSVPVMSDGKAIGTLTVGVRVGNLK